MILKRRSEPAVGKRDHMNNAQQHCRQVLAASDAWLRLCIRADKRKLAGTRLPDGLLQLEASRKGRSLPVSPLLVLCSASEELQELNRSGYGQSAAGRSCLP